MRKKDYQDFVKRLQPAARLEVRAVGGYWPVNAAMAVTVQHLGDAAEAALEDDVETAAYLLFCSAWVIACVANQYGSDLSRAPTWRDQLPGDSRDDLLLAFSECGRVLRITNQYENAIYTDDYEGKSISGPICRLHNAAFSGIEKFGFSVDDMLQRRLAEVSGYRGRADLPPNKRLDPTTAESLERFGYVIERTYCPYARKAKAWGAEPWDASLSTREYARVLRPTLERFSRAAPIEGLDALVIERRDINGLDPLVALTKELLLEIGRYSSPNPMSRAVSRREWRYVLPGGTEAFLTVFSPLYPSTHPRHSIVPGSTFFVLQTQASFKARNVRDIDKQNVRNRFSEAGQDYMAFLKRVSCEAEKYLKPLDLENGQPVRWWE